MIACQCDYLKISCLVVSGNGFVDISSFFARSDGQMSSPDCCYVMPGLENMAHWVETLQLLASRSFPERSERWRNKIPILFEIHTIENWASSFIFITKHWLYLLHLGTQNIGQVHRDESLCGRQNSTGSKVRRAIVSLGLRPIDTNFQPVPLTRSMNCPSVRSFAFDAIIICETPMVNSYRNYNDSKKL
jgi:hypothetical protein